MENFYFILFSQSKSMNAYVDRSYACAQSMDA